MKTTKNELNIIHINNKDFNSLLKTNQRYINTLAYSFGVDDAEVINDLIQVGRIGLFNAYQNFDLTKSPVFIGYASWYIRKEMIQFLNDNTNTIKISYRTRELLKAGQIPATRTISMQHPINDSGGIVEDLIANPVDSVENDFKGLETAVLKLNSEQQYLINLYYGLNDTVPVKQKDIAVMFGCSHQNINDKISKAIAALKKIMINK